MLETKYFSFAIYFFARKNVNLQYMMKTEPKLIGEIISQYLNPKDLDACINERRMEAAWGDVVGPYINKLTMRRYVNKRVLHVVISSAPLKNELMINRAALVKRLNDAVGADVIDDIVFR